MNETSVETVAGTHRIHRCDSHTSAAPFLRSFPRHGATHAEFYYDELAKLRESINRLLQIIRTGHFFCFALVRKEYVNERQHVQQIGSPLAFRIIVGVQ